MEQKCLYIYCTLFCVLYFCFVVIIFAKFSFVCVVLCNAERFALPADIHLYVAFFLVVCFFGCHFCTLVIVVG